MNPLKIFFTSILLVFIFSVFAQSRSLTFLGGLNVADISIKYGNSPADIEDTYKLKMAFHGGVLFDKVFSKDRKRELSVESGLLFDLKGVKQELAEMGFQQNNSLILYYVDIPVYLKFSKKLRSRDKLYAGIGPYLGVGMFGEMENSYGGEDGGSSSSETINWGSDETEDDLKRLDYGVAAKVGYLTYTGLNISASYDFGIANVSAAGANPELKHRVLRLSLAYTLKLDD